MSKRIMLALVLSMLLVVGLTGTALAHSMGAANGGAEAFSPHTSTQCSGTHPRVRITDLASDGFSVRADYYRGTNGPYSVTETRGNGYTSWSGCGSTITRIRACVVKPLLPDSCTAWVY